MTEAERAILKNQLALMRMSTIPVNGFTAQGAWAGRVTAEVARCISATCVLLYDPSAMCSCSGRGDKVHTIATNKRQMFVCDFCDREIEGKHHERT